MKPQYCSLDVIVSYRARNEKNARKPLTYYRAVAWILTEPESLQEERNSEVELRSRFIAVAKGWNIQVSKGDER